MKNVKFTCFSTSRPSIPEGLNVALESERADCIFSNKNLVV